MYKQRTAQDSDKFKYCGFLWFTFRMDKKSRGGGVAVYARNDISEIRRTDLEIEGVEGLWLEIILPKSRGFLVGTFYRPPDSSKYDDKDFLPKLDSVLDAATVLGKEVVLTGYFNYDLLPAKSKTQDCKQLKNLFKVFNFKQFITDPTRITQHSSSLLDLMSTNCPGNISHSGVITSCLSDHDMVYVVRKINWKKAPVQFKAYRNCANYDPTSFSKELELNLQATDGSPSGHVNNSQSDEQDVEL